MKIEFGWHMQSFPTNGADGAAFLGDLHRTLDNLGEHFSSVWVDDHVHPWGNFVDRDVPATEAATTIAYFAARYPQFDWGSLVFCQSYRNPALLAKMAANLQWMSGGRYIFGIGAGWLEEEYDAYGWAFPRPAARIAQMDETIQIVRKLWTETPASFEGEHYSIEDAYLMPKPDPLPPIMVGGGGEQLTLRVVAREADWWNLPATGPDQYAHKLEVLRRHCETVGRNYDEIRKTVSLPVIGVAASAREAAEQVQRSPYSRGKGISGTPEEVAKAVLAYVNLGVDLFQVHFADFPDTEGARLFHDEVIPRVQEAAN